ncbi:unnamed protein product, partial [Choristocarpus tenellus]
GSGTSGAPGAIGMGEGSGAASVAAAEEAEAAAERYRTAYDFLTEHPEFHFIWVASSCMPPRLRNESWRGAVPGVGGVNVFQHLHPVAILACDAVLAAPPEREGLGWLSGAGERYTDLETYRSVEWRGVCGEVRESLGIFIFLL